MSRLVVSAALPPPIHGQSTISLAMIKIFIGAGFDSVKVINSSPRSLNRSLKYHLLRLFSLFLTVFNLLVFRFFSLDVVFYTVYESGYGVFYNFVSCGIARLLGYRIFLHHHTSRHILRRSGFFSVLVMLLGKSCTHVVLADKMRLNIVAMYPTISKVYVLPNIALLKFDGDGSHLRHFDTSGYYTFGLLSNLTVEKGAVDVLDAVRYLIDRGLRVRLLLAGPVVDDEVRCAIERFAIDFPNVLNTIGPITNNSEKINFYSNVDFFLFPSKYIFEAQPLVLIEALSSGCICIASDVGYISDILANAGFVYSGSDWGAYILDLLKSLDSEGLSSLSKGSFERFLYLNASASDSLHDFVRLVRAADKND
ncbi:glycosyltransferase family 4 protein [Curvibacter sp. HBC61]|uniref:Glycosyltransferase family 4 protein n=1 Tax=Curvibacter cyanobacteriorum TaxID=3026422 RepID=A0ABT5MW12_9BURK|nr:glycosyltransferase family 4 protein [Curvibacter sp. HBC61]MDD0838246.1 glycosyltransferase family 4 protein [Curvibacter sp. HBC61]